MVGAFLNQCLIMVIRQISSERIVIQVALEKLQRIAEHIYRVGC